jgi:tungstate transport system substrate-binding protein
MRSRRTRARAALGAAVIAAGAVGATVAASAAQATTIRIVGTSDLFDSNFFQSSSGISGSFLNSPFAEAGDTLTYLAEGTGKALTSAKTGAYDVVMVHSPSLEAAWVAAGYSYEPLGRSLLYNDYEIVGPTGDPAGVTTNDPTNAIGAYERIAAQGNLGNATFVSRNDTSGTNVQEETMWGQTTGVTLQLAQNGAGNPLLYQPAASPGVTAYPSWYALEPTANQNQGPNLVATNNCTNGSFASGSGSTANGHNCYTMSDDGTIQYLKPGSASGTIPNLKVVVASNSATAIGGTTELVNPFHVYIVNPVDPATGGTYPGGPSFQPNVANALRLVNWITGVSGSAGISGGGTGPSGPTGPLNSTFQNSVIPHYLSLTGNGPLTGDAYPTVVSASPGQSQTVHSAGANVTVTGSLRYGPPPNLAVVGMPYQLQISINSGASWTVISSGGATSGAGGAITGTVTPAEVPSGDTATIRLVEPGPYDDTDTGIKSQFSPYNDTVDFGKITNP